MRTKPIPDLPAHLPPDLLACLPADLTAQWRNATITVDTIGCSAATVMHLQHPDGRETYVKLQPVDRGPALQAEHSRLAWLQGRLPVPEVLAFRQTPAYDVLWMSAVPGYHAGTPAATSRPAETVQALADGLHRIHAVSIADCPFDKRVPVRLAEAKANMEAGRVDTDDFDPSRLGRAPADLYAELLRSVPLSEDLVFTHGDYCLPNVLLDRGAVSGFIDWGNAGVSDRWQDLALAMRSVAYNLGPEWVEPFLAAYGLTGLDAAKVEFFQLLDEFF